MKRERKKPTDRDFEVFQEVLPSLMEFNYGGLSGYFQIAGHKQLEQWSHRFIDGIVLDVGCGNGHHITHSKIDYASYIGLELDTSLLHNLQERHPRTISLQGDMYTLPFATSSVDCVLSVYTFEHLRELPKALRDIRRVLKPDGELLIGLPTEGGFAYDLGRRLTSERVLSKRYDFDYGAIARWEHWNTYQEVVEAVSEYFDILEQNFIPFNAISSIHVNIIGCLRTKAKGE